MKFLKKNMLAILVVVLNFFFYAQLCAFNHLHPVDEGGKVRVKVHLHCVNHHDNDHSHQTPGDQPHEGEVHCLSANVVHRVHGLHELASSLKDFACAGFVFTNEPNFFQVSCIVTASHTLPIGFIFTRLSRSPPVIAYSI